MTAGRHVSIGHQDFRVDIRKGDRSRVPLLMCGGIGASLEILQPVVDTVHPDIEIVRFDVPGVGGSPTASLPYGFPQLAWQLGRLLDQLGYPQLDLMGYSWGGALAQQLAVQFPRRFRRAALISTNTGVCSVPGDPRVMATMLEPRYFDHLDETVALARHLRRLTIDGQAPGVPHRVWGPEVLGDGRGYLHQLAAVGAWTSLPFLPFVRQPVLIMSGDQDPIVPLINARILASLIPRSTLRVFSGGHFDIVTAAAQFGREMSTFFA